MASDQARDLVVQIIEILDPIIVLFDDDQEVTYATFDHLAEVLDGVIAHETEELAD